MICPKCNAEVPENVKFCPSCGESIVSNSDAAAEVKEAVEEKVEAVEEKVEEKVEENVEKVEEAVDDIPTAAFDPGAPIAVPKKKAAEAAAAVEEKIEETVPEVAPVESVMPEFPQTDPVPAPPIAPEAVTPVVPVAPAPAPVSLNPQTVATPAPADPIPSKAEVTEENIPKEYRPLSVGGAFWMMLLFAIPVVGLVFSIIFSVSGWKKSRKNMARAVLIWKVIGLILAMVAFILIFFLCKDLFEAMMGGDINEVIDAINELTGA